MAINIDQIDFESLDAGGVGINEPDQQATIVKANMGEAFKTNPDAYAKTAKLSKASGVPEFAVESDPVEVETKLKLDQIDFDQLLVRNPNTAKYLVDFNNAVIAQDDIDNLIGIENVLVPVGDVTRSLPSGFLQSFGSASEGLGRTLEITERMATRGLDFLLPESVDPYIYETDETPDWLKKINTFTRPIVDAPKQALSYAGGNLKRSAKAVGAPESRQNLATDISTALGNMAGQLLTYVANPAVGVTSTFAQGVDIQGEKQEATGTEGETLAGDLGMLAGGAVTAATEKIGFDKLLNRIPPNIKNNILKQMADITIAGGIEALQETVEGLAQNLIELYTTNPDAELFEGLDRDAMAAGGAGSIARAIVNALVPGRARSVNDDEAYKEYQNQIDQQKIDQLAAKSEASALRNRDAESFRQFVQQSDGENNNQVFIDSAQVALYLQSKTPQEIEADPALQKLIAASREAATLGVDVSMPVADFATDLVGTPHYEQLREHMTMTEGAVSPFRQEQVKTETVNYVQRVMADAQENASEYIAAQDIYNTVKDQLVDSGRVNSQNAAVMAQIVPAWATSYAKRQGITVAEAYERSGLKVEGPQTGEAARLSDEALAQEPITDEAQQLIDEISSFSEVSKDGLVTLYHRTSKENADQIRSTGVMTPKENGIFFSTKKEGQNVGYGDEIVTFKVPANELVLDDIFDDEAHLRLPAKINKKNDVKKYLEQIDQTEAVDQLAKRLETDLGLKSLFLSVSKKDNQLIISNIVVPKEKQGQGIGTKAMSEIINYADQNGLKVVLSPGLPDDRHGTTSRSRLVKFYKRFGFVENKGRNKDFTISEGVYREPALTQNTGTTRGYYDPANSVIRLTEASDLSTFLHEFAHFMYEMEMAADTDLIQSVNGWFKRNADAVAAEANGYIGKVGQLEQSKVDQTETEAFKNWFGDSKVVDENGKPLVVYHGTGGDFEIFDPKKAGMGNDRGMRGRGFYFSPNEKTASSYGDNIVSVYLSIKKPFNPSDFKSKQEISEKLNVDEAVFEYSQNGEFKVYQSFSGTFTSALKDAGYDGVIYPLRQEVIAFNPNQIKSATGNKGTFDPKNPSILEQSDTPTGEQGSITSDDVVAFLDNKTTGDVAKDAAIRRATHEQFARGFETYLMKGESPSIELRNAFRAFARWLVQIYKSIRGDLNVNLDAEMSQVFDRLLATDEQIAAAEGRARYEPMFTDAAVAGMSEQEFADYKKRQEKVKDKQTETLREKLIKQLTRQTEAWWKEEKEDVTREEVARLNEEKVYVTRNRLLHTDIKLDHATVKEMVGVTGTDARGHTFTKIPPTLTGMTAKAQAGIHPDEAAALFGYGSGSEMLNDLMTAPKIKDLAEQNAQQIMIERHGDILTDGTIEKEADEAVQNEERGKLFLDELKALAKGTNQVVFDRQTIKDIAEQRIGELSFREIHPGKYRKAEIQAAQESASMLAKGNREGAASAKARQVLNYYLGMAATNAKNDTLKIVDRMSRYNKKNVREEIQKAEGGYWGQIVKILERFEFRKSATLGQVDRVNQDINTWMKERIETDGDGLVLTPAVLNESYVTHWKNVPYSDLQGINDSVKNIEHVARYANKITRLGEEVDFNKLVDRWVTSITEKGTNRFAAKRTDVVEGRNWGRWMMAQMTKIPYMASWLDGGERAGISHQILVQPFTDAYSAEIKLWNATGKAVMGAIESRSKEDIKRHNQKVYIPEIKDNLFGHQILAVALNTGNESNLRKLLLGEGWADPDKESEISPTNPKLKAVLSRMTKSDWELVQLIWDQMDTLYPQLAEVHRRTTGLIPPKIDAAPVVTPFGTFKGGYYPVKYDPAREHRAQLNEEKANAQLESMFSNTASIQASVNAGATNERTGYYAPIRLSLDVVASHFQETIHYITHHDPVREINRLTRNKSVADAIRSTLGPEEYAQLKPWLNDIAKDGREAPTKMFWDSILQRLRFGVTLGTMGFKASTGIIQVSGLSNTVAEVGFTPMMQALRSVLGSPKNMRDAWEFAKANSKVIEFRAQTMDREIKNALKNLSTSTNVKTGRWAQDFFNTIDSNRVLKTVQQASMKHIALIQTFMVDLPSWQAAYIKGMNEWGDEARAYQYADWVIENVQGSGATKDLAAIMRGQSETGRMFTMFMTFFSSLWNMERDLVKGAKSGRYSPSTLAAKAMFLFTIPVLFDMLMKGELGDDDDDDDDEESQTQKMLTKVALYPVQSVPFVRDIANGVTGDFGYNISPLASILEQGTRSIPAVMLDGFQDDEEISKSEVKGSTKFAGAAFGVPGTSQAWATGEHLYDVMVEGEELTLHQLLFGPEKN